MSARILCVLATALTGAACAEQRVTCLATRFVEAFGERDLETLRALSSRRLDGEVWGRIRPYALEDAVGAVHWTYRWPHWGLPGIEPAERRVREEDAAVRLLIGDKGRSEIIVLLVDEDGWRIEDALVQGRWTLRQLFFGTSG